MNRWILIALLLIAPATSFARNLKPATVKVISRFTEDPTILYGSGLGFTFQGQAYVVTSDHVLWHDNDGITQRIHTFDGTELACSFVMSDYGRGLALLKVTSAFDVTTWPTLASLIGASPVANAPAAMLGYPASSDGLVRDTSGQLTSLAFTAGIYFQTPTLLQISHGHAEFGMSGGVLSDANGGFLGLLAFQVYNPDPAGVVNTILAIPAPEILDWLLQALTGPTPVRLGQNVGQQMDKSGVTNFTTGHLVFSYLQPYSDGNYMVVITSTPAPQGRVYGDHTGDFARYESYLLAHDSCEMQIFGFRKRGQRGTSVGNTGPFGALLRMDDPAYEALPNLWCNDSDEAKSALVTAFRKLQKLDESFTPPDAGPLTAALQSIVTDLDGDTGDGDPFNNYYVNVKPSDVQILIDSPDYQSSWQALARTGRAESLRQMIQDVIAALGRLTI